MTKKKVEAPAVKKKEKPTPAFLREDYPYKAIGDAITDLETLEPNGVLYEINCPKCEMSIRGQGVRIKKIYSLLFDGFETKDADGRVFTNGGKGCIGCGNRELVVKKVDTSRMAEVEATRKAHLEEERTKKG